ncbi:hypothetical protein [Herbaspirillum huttiense]|uniref:Uncharacterized protein n=2 Tax=Herbaspirillum huttiense TaxID=863372 RepID=A0AAJ2H9J7_9BURK|nr:hypothetical protein [Herbaspirillum huttiense]MDR9836406.1 hypothetical protein [Herbaspirillum huttiense]
MSTVTYQSHPIRGLINGLHSLKSDTTFYDPSIGWNEASSYQRDRIFAVIELLASLLEEVPASLVSFPALAQMQNHLQNVTSELNAFLSSKSLGHLANAAAQIDPLQSFLWALPVSSLQGGAWGRLLDSQALGAQNALDELLKRQESYKSELSALASQTENYQKKLEEMSQQIAKQNSDVSTAIAKFEQQYKDEVDLRGRNVTDVLMRWDEQYSELKEKIAFDSQKILTDLDTKREQASRILQVVGNIGVTGNYQAIANKENSQANFWRWITVSFFAVGVALAGLTFVKFWSEPFSSETAISILVRLLYAIALTTPAWYTAKESARHRTNADRARQTELELASIGPFIELMPEDKKVEIRESLTKSYFGKGVEQHNVEAPFSSKDLKDFAVEILKAAKKP